MAGGAMFLLAAIERYWAEARILDLAEKTRAEARATNDEVHRRLRQPRTRVRRHATQRGLGGARPPRGPARPRGGAGRLRPRRAVEVRRAGARRLGAPAVGRDG